MSASITNPSVLVFVAPALLGSALARLLRPHASRLAVVDTTAAPNLDRRYDIAVVSSGMPDGIAADTVIHLPGRASNRGCIARGTRMEPVTIERLEDILHLMSARRSEPGASVAQA